MIFLDFLDFLDDDDEEEEEDVLAGGLFAKNLSTAGKDPNLLLSGDI